MKISTERLKQIIQEELARTSSDNELLLERGPQISAAFQPLRALYEEASPEQREDLENNIIDVFKNMINEWRQTRENPDAWKSGY